MDSNASLVFGGMAGLIVKIVYDWLSTGRGKEISKFIDAKECDEHRAKCCIISIKKTVAENDVRVLNLEREISKISKELSESVKSNYRVEGKLEAVITEIRGKSNG